MARQANISHDELWHIQAALDWWRQCGFGNAENRPPPSHAIATNGGAGRSLNDAQTANLITQLDGAESIVVTWPQEVPDGAA